LFLIIVTSNAFISGCGTIHDIGGREPKIYGGTPTSVTRNLTNAEQMVAAVLQAVPKGSPRESAKSFMEKEGFICSIETNQNIGELKGVDYLYCDRSERSGCVARRWQVLIIYRDNKVVDVQASTGLVGP